MIQILGITWMITKQNPKVVILPLLSYSIDRLSNYSHIILWVFLGLEIVIELISVLNPSHDVLVAVLIFVHNMANAFEMSALWKTFKQMVSFDETTTNLEQNKTLTLMFLFFNIYHIFCDICFFIISSSSSSS